MGDTITGYNPNRGDASGFGGRQRDARIVSDVDKAAGSESTEPAKPAETSSEPKSASYLAKQAAVASGSYKQHPAASTDEATPAVQSHVYGSPIEGNSASK